MTARFGEFMLEPDWPRLGNTERRVRSLMTCRAAPPDLGVSAGQFAAFDGGPGLNLGLGSGEDRGLVRGNRERLEAALGMPICWIDQVHGTTVAEFTGAPLGAFPKADAAFTRASGIALAVLVADCMPILFADEQAQCVAVAHAGWRGLSAGVIEAAVAALPAQRGALHAWLGPAIGKHDFEVGVDVLEAFVRVDPSAGQAFVKKREGKWCGDLAWLARQRLAKLGVTAHGDAPSTFADPGRFYSFRRDKVTGRMAALIWIEQD
jgi:YfiH family protein